MNSTKTVEGRKIDTEIVVVGGGGAGLAAAIAAAEKGANVVVLEKRRAPGGNTAMAYGIFAAESHIQKRMQNYTSKDELFKIAMEYTHWKVNPKIIRAFLDKSAETIQWLEDKGVEFTEVRSMNSEKPDQYPYTIHFPTGKCAGVIKMLVKQSEALGVPIFNQTTAKRILTSTGGNVRGILATTKDGEELIINAKAVIIATGGFAGNRELLKKYCPSYNENIRFYGVPNTGDGLLMATEIGAATEGLGVLQLHTCIFWGSSIVQGIIRFAKPEAIWVNKNGERFVDETITFNCCEAGNTVNKQLDNVFYTLFDSKFLRNAVKDVGSGFDIPFPKDKPLDLEEGFQLLEGGLQLEASKGKVKIADSWDEIAGWIGVNPQILKATIEEYNACCDQGHDKVFLKDRRYLSALRTPPYYAIKRQLAFFCTHGVIKINHHMEVLNNQDRPIPGLFAAGIDTGGWESDTYNIKLSGSSVGFAINSGRIAGENAIKNVPRYGL